MCASMEKTDRAPRDDGIRSPDEVTDAALAQAAREGLAWDARAPARQLHVRVAQSVITLTGTVDTSAERDDAQRCVEGLRGVRRIDNQIQVREGSEPAKVKRAIESALARHAARGVARLEIAVGDGHVLVGGSVRSEADRRTIVGAIRGLRGVVAVEDRLVIEGDPREPG
jgi:osmotically-inducible protein OsmY